MNADGDLAPPENCNSFCHTLIQKTKAEHSMVIIFCTFTYSYNDRIHYSHHKFPICQNQSWLCPNATWHGWSTSSVLGFVWIWSFFFHSGPVHYFTALLYNQYQYNFFLPWFVHARNLATFLSYYEIIMHNAWSYVISNFSCAATVQAMITSSLAHAVILFVFCFQRCLQNKYFVKIQNNSNKMITISWITNYNKLGPEYNLTALISNINCLTCLLNYILNCFYLCFRIWINVFMYMFWFFNVKKALTMLIYTWKSIL